MCYGPTLVENSFFCVYLFVNFFLQIIIIPFHFIVSYVQIVTQHYESKTVWKAPVQPLQKIRTISITKGSHHVLPPNWHFSLSAKINGTQRRTLVSPWRMNCTYCGMPKGTSRVEATSNNEKIKPIALAVIMLCFSEGISQSVTQSVIH